MITMKSFVVAGAMLCAAAGPTFAQTPAAPNPAPAYAATPMAPAGKMAKPRTVQSIACSGKADQQNLHGKARKTFMSQCKRGKM